MTSDVVPKDQSVLVEVKGTAPFRLGFNLRLIVRWAVDWALANKVMIGLIAGRFSKSAMLLPLVPVAGRICKFRRCCLPVFQAMEEAVISSRTVVACASFCREVLLDCLLANP